MAVHLVPKNLYEDKCLFFLVKKAENEVMAELLERDGRRW
jgi:hypothetical protein